jgi:Asp/Glu/hydantoin racemase
MSDDKMVSEYDVNQRAAVCRSAFEEKMAAEKVSFDYDETLSTAKGMKLAAEWINKGADVYIISARSNTEPMLTRAKEIGIPNSRIYAMGSNKAKVEQILQLGISKHYDNNADVIKQLGKIGQLI